VWSRLTVGQPGNSRCSGGERGCRWSGSGEIRGDPPLQPQPAGQGVHRMLVGFPPVQPGKRPAAASPPRSRRPAPRSPTSVPNQPITADEHQREDLCQQQAANLETWRARSTSAAARAGSQPGAAGGAAAAGLDGVMSHPRPTLPNRGRVSPTRTRPRAEPQRRDGVTGPLYLLDVIYASRDTCAVDGLRGGCRAQPAGAAGPCLAGGERSAGELVATAAAPHPSRRCVRGHLRGACGKSGLVEGSGTMAQRRIYALAARTCPGGDRRVAGQVPPLLGGAPGPPWKRPSLHRPTADTT